MKEKTCCFTGHRIIPANEYTAIQKRLESEIINLINQGVRCFLAGGALGFDTMAALAVLSLKEKYPHVQLILILPCKNQTAGWTEADKKIYDQILIQADKAVYTSEHYYNGCMFTRNRHLIDNSVVCVCYLKSVRGGTAYTVDYAKRKGLKIIRACLKNPTRTAFWRFFRRTALKFLEIRAYSFKILPCAAKKSLKNLHTGIFQTRPNLASNLL